MDAQDRIPITSRLPAERFAQLFPVLTPAQIARFASFGRSRSVDRGEVLVEPGTRAPRFFVVVEGEIDILQADGRNRLISILRPGMFTGEVTMLSGRGVMVRLVAGAPSKLVEVENERMLSLVQTDDEIGELVLRAFILRRTELIAQGVGDVVLIGSNHSAGTLRVKEFLTRNSQPYAFVDLDRDADVQEFLDRFGVSVADVPIVICRGAVALRDPDNAAIADCLGLNPEIEPGRVRDVAIVGGGPSGLAAAVYGASEGLDVLVVEARSPGGQAASSSKIENYLGFPMGISGQDLAARAYAQATKFGAQLVVAKAGKRLACARRPFAIEIEDGARVPARAVIIATGAEYRRLSVDGLSGFEGVGVYYGATFVEAMLCRDEDVIVVGGGNSAGQAAMFLAESSRRVFMLVRGEGLDATMSRYLVRRIEQSPKIELHPRTEIEAVEGEGHLERVRWVDRRQGSAETRAIRHVFVMTGAVPATAWLEGCVALDADGFIKTGPDLSREELDAAKWPLARPPYLLETSLPGVFAVGDVRSSNVKRVASAVGEGSIAISFVHRVLAE